MNETTIPQIAPASPGAPEAPHEGHPSGLTDTPFRLDPVRYSGRPLDEAARTAEELACYDLLDSLSVPYFRADHGPAATIALCHQVEQVLGADICKNLFLCNRQQTQFYLLLMDGDKVFKTKFLSKQLGTARLSFADPGQMEEYLHLAPGSASVLGLMYDSQKKVQLVIDQSVLDKPLLGCHPCINTSTLALTMEDVMGKLLPAIGHSPVIVNLPQEDLT